MALFRGLPQAELEVLAGQVVRKHYGRNDVIFPQGACGEGLITLERGHVRIVDRARLEACADGLA